jgi:hypothetical protein
MQNNIKNLEIFNYPTFDFYMSGDYFIDRKLLIKNLKIKLSHLSGQKVELIKENEDITKEKFTRLFNSLSEEKLKILIKNWSGTSIINKSYDYIIIIDKHPNINVYFRACTVTIEINNNLLENNNDSDTILIDILTTPCNNMID